jgi:ribonucleoside-diphosphate reductase alpha chain
MAMAPEQTGIGIRRHFTTEGVDPYDEVVWERRDARITNYRDGVVAFEQLGVEFPTGWSQNAANIVAQKYFRGALGSPEREHSLRQVIDRVVDTVTAWGTKDGYFVDDAEAEAFRAELKHLVMHQKAAFNSPVWFNIGVKGEPQQASACQPYDALVSTPEGLVPIGKLVEDRAVGTKVFDASGVTRIVAVKANGQKSVLRLSTKSGHTLDVTADHLVWRASGVGCGRFVPAGELRVGDRLTWHRHTAWGEGEISGRAVAEAALAGWLQADGFVGQYAGTNRSLTVEAMTVTEAERAWVLKAIETVFPDVHRHERRVPTQSTALDCRRTRLYGAALEDFVSRWDLRVRGTEMTVPDSMFTAPLPVVAAYLRSLFQAEGYVSRRERSAVVGLAMISEQFVRGLQALLLRFGVFSRVRFAADRRSDRHGTWVLAIRTAGDRRRFADEIGFIDPVKADKLEASFDLPGSATHDSKQLEIARIDELGTMDVYDIQTESGEYLSGGLRVHNCFILAVDDTMKSILNWYVEEGTIFKGGSGSGINLSNIRSSYEHLKGGGTASGPVSFMRGADASAGTIKSGGKTRRAAKMVILNADHPDIEDFIWCKAVEERKARVLRDAGFDMDLDGKDSHSTQYQNANNSVRVTDEFMQAVADDGDWALRAVTTGGPIRMVKARQLFRQIAEATWECADPGMQFDTTINRWHTASNTGPINASNPCSEYMHLDNSACNLASLNLLKFMDENGTFDVDGFKAAVEVVFTAQEILVGNADYPTEKIGQNARRFRQLGLGYANLGAMLMALGIAYDSDAGRTWAAGITSLMTGHAYATSARTAARMGPFAGYSENREPMNRVLRMHRDEARRIDPVAGTTDVIGAAQEAWDQAVEWAEDWGVRNSQASVLAPTGTIGLMMDCDTTGIEPDLGLCKTKKLVGGGTMSIVNQTVPRALRRLGYSPRQVDDIVAYIDEHKSILGAPHLAPEHLDVFACSMGDNVIHYLGHVRMMAAVQPWISGAISKCVTGDTLLATADGLVRIGSLHGGETPDTFRHEILAVASTGGVQKTDAFYYGGRRPVRKVVLRSGHRVVGTPNHRLQVAGSSGLEWRRLDEIEVGEYVATQYGSEMWSALPARFDDFAPTAPYGAQKTIRLPDEMTEELAFLLGAYASEGHTTTANWSVTITNSVDAVLDRVVTAWRSEFGIQARVVRQEGKCPSIVAASKTAVQFLQHLGCGGRASAKRIPDAVLCSPRHMVLAFLQGLALDASVSVRSMPKWAICLDSPAMLDDLQAVLTNLGIVHSRISKRNAVYGKTYDEVYATGEHARRMVELVPFLEPDKSARAAQLQALASGPSSADVVPGITLPELQRLVPKGYRSQFSCLHDVRTSRVSRGTLERIAALPGVDLPAWLRTVLDDDLRFSPVESVVDAGEQEVFDISVPATSAFVGNGIVNHNTINMPETATVEEMEQLHIDAWRMGLKAVAVYRDNCKVAQPLSTTKKDAAPTPVQPILVKQPVRERLPRMRNSKTFSFRVADCHGYVTVGEYDDGRPGEIFLRVAKQGSTLAGIMDAFAISVSHGLQYGVPLRAFVDMYTNMRFEPAGITDDAEIRFASSLVDYIFRRLAVEYLSAEERADLGILTVEERMQPTLPGVEEQATPTSTGSEVVPDPAPVGAASPAASDAPYCYVCGVVMQRAGACFVCSGCGTTSGCS